MPRSLPSGPAAILAAFARQALHAGELRFAHPQDGRAMRLQAPLPGDFARLLEALEEGDPA